MAGPQHADVQLQAQPPLVVFLTTAITPQVAHLLVLPLRRPQRRQHAAAQQLRQARRVAPVGLDPRLPRRCHQPAMKKGGVMKLAE